MADNSSASGGVVKIELKDIDITETIGSGGFGEVKKGCYNRKTVAVKFLAPQGRQITKRDKRDFQKEARRLSEASHHESILNIHGVVLDENTFALVLEYMHFGNVEDFIKDFNVGVPLRMRILEQIISAMDYLHSHNPPIKHLDLKAANVLINCLFIAKVCDFGLSEFKTKTVTEELVSNRRATHTHVAPEVLKDITMKASTAQDVYAFAITTWEIFTGEEVYKGKDRDTITQCVMRQQRPDLNCLVQGCPDYVRNLIKICWDHQPGRRPTFRGIKDAFGKLYAKYSQKLRTSCIDIRRQICEKHVCHPGDYEELFKCTEVWDRSPGKEMLRDSGPNTSATVQPQENRPRLERELRLESEVRLEGEQPILRGEPTAQTQLSSSAESSQVTPDGNPESSLLTNVAGPVS